MQNNMKMLFLHPILSIFLFTLFYKAQGMVEMCNPQSTNIFVFSRMQCPGGVLFTEPQEFGCLELSTGVDPTDWKEDACSDIAYSSKKVQLMVNLDDEKLSVEESCSGDGDDKCKIPLMTITKLNLRPKERATSEELYDPTPEELQSRNDTAVIDQTERLLKYLHGLLEDPEDDGPVLRIVQLLRKSFKLLNLHCDERWVANDFTNEILRAFLFILREADINRIKDISIEEYDRIMLALDQCGIDKTTTSMTLNGSECITNPKIFTIEVPPYPIIKFKRNPMSFIFNKYDIVVDATWSIVDFIHGMCFHKFSPHFNSHHLYEQAMERLFTDEIIFRWTRPTTLTTPEAWDAVFLGNVKSNMRNIDACIQGGYAGKPYLHRLERMLEKQTQKQAKRRRRRELSDSNSLDGGGWCFQSASERQEVLAELCSGNRTSIAPSASNEA